ncbi:hypothetical protein DSLASN_24540 [Desulfoluna limicola]|uniref:Uncharacterized protein n=1 Tax=Desulfoluna limicola TaxID=2810562 RepID=A0ABM7PGZ8_9BACT|nr:hypothetical protein DSLASN_24540 [Desulfoluna limicola]
MSGKRSPGSEAQGEGKKATVHPKGVSATSGAHRPPVGGDARGEGDGACFVAVQPTLMNG